jgi:hypothetical protein
MSLPPITAITAIKAATASATLAAGMRTPTKSQLRQEALAIQTVNAMAAGGPVPEFGHAMLAQLRAEQIGGTFTRLAIEGTEALRDAYPDRSSEFAPGRWAVPGSAEGFASDWLATMA